tara:strand:- start:11005 stop:11355 length:351 start_codon:yes stop_codon:yes gene_type:complete
MNNNVLSTKSFDFSIEVIALYKELTDKKEFVISKQLLRSGTSIGANIFEANYAFSKKDFVHKLTISRKEANESIYWLKLLKHSKFLEELEVDKLLKQCDEIMRILTSSIKTSRKIV